MVSSNASSEQSWELFTGAKLCLQAAPVGDDALGRFLCRFKNEERRGWGDLTMPSLTTIDNSCCITLYSRASIASTVREEVFNATRRPENRFTRV